MKKTIKAMIFAFIMIAGAMLMVEVLVYTIDNFSIEYVITGVCIALFAALTFAIRPYFQ